MRNKSALTRIIGCVILTLSGMSLLTGCGTSSKTDYLQGHSWGESESESKSIGWDNYKPVSGLEMTLSLDEHCDDRLCDIEYRYYYDSREDSDNQKPKELDYYVQKFEKKYGEPYSTEEYDDGDGYTWYVDGIKIEFYYMGSWWVDENNYAHGISSNEIEEYENQGKEVYETCGLCLRFFNEEYYGSNDDTRRNGQ